MPQLPLIREVLDALHIPVARDRGRRGRRRDRDARDARRRRGDRRVLVTGDRDTYQLVHDPHLKVLYNKRGVSDYALYDEAGIFERTGVTPAQYPDYAALRGDPSDNLPGVPGIGEKTAAKLISTYGNLEGILEHVDELPPKQRQNLTETRDRVLLNREMSRLLRDVELDVGPSRARQGAWDKEQVRVLFDQLAFRTLLPRIMEAVGRSRPSPRPRRRPSTSRSRCCATRRGRRAALDASSRAGELLRARTALGRRARHDRAARGRARHRRRPRRVLRRRGARRPGGARPRWPRAGAPAARRSSRTGPRS